MAAGMRRAVLGTGLALCGLGMTCIAPEDPDATPSGSRPLALGEWQRDALDCGRFLSRDCTDWYHLEAPGEGTLRLDVAKVQDEQEVPTFVLALGEASGRVIEKAPAGGRTRVRLDAKVREGRYTVSVGIAEDAGGGMAYELRASFQPKPRPAPRAPRYSAVEATLLEVETRDDGSEAVLLDKGSRVGIAPGQKGRLLQDGETIAEIEILDVYPDGSRAVIRGSLGAAITPSTVAEVDVPL